MAKEEFTYSRKAPVKERALASDLLIFLLSYFLPYTASF